MRKLKKSSNKRLVQRGYRFKPSRQIVNIVGDYIHDIWDKIMPYGSIILFMSQKAGMELTGEQIAMVARGRLFTAPIALTSLAHATALIEANRFSIPLLVENGMIMYKSGLYNCETCEPGNHVVHGIIDDIIPGLTRDITAIRESLRLKEKFAFALQSSHEVFTDFSIPEIVRIISSSEPEMLNYNIEAFFDQLVTNVLRATNNLSNLEVYKLVKRVFNDSVAQEIKDAIDDYYNSIDGLEDMLFGNLIRSSKISATFQSHRFAMVSRMASFDKTPNRMFIDAMISSFSVVNKGSYAYLDKTITNRPFSVEYGMLPDANREVVNISKKDIVVRFDENGSYIQDLKMIEPVNSTKYTAEHIYIDDTFDMVVPYFIDSLDDIASIIPTICSVTTYSRDQEDAFNDLLTDPVSHKLLCSPEVYEELYDDMWHLLKKVVVVKTLDGRMYVFNNNFELRYKISGHTVTEDHYFVNGVVNALRTMGEYLYNHTLDGIDITYLEHEDHSNKISYTTPHYRKGCVVKAHFRHYKSGVITFVKPHVRRGTNVINGKIVIDIK